MAVIPIFFRDIGLNDYQKVWNYQKSIFAEVLQAKQNMEIQDGNKNIQPLNYLIFCEHPHVYTLGKSGSESNLLISHIQLRAKNTTFFKTDRGGDITYHGPGQIVGYPIINLESFNIGIKEYVCRIEEVIIRTLKEFSINAVRLAGATGVWLDTGTPHVRKICAVGIKASRHITMHGFAFNVNTSLDYFRYINPCGFTDKAVTSMEKELGSKQDMKKVKEIVKDKFAGIFGVNFQ